MTSEQQALIDSLFHLNFFKRNKTETVKLETPKGMKYFQLTPLVNTHGASVGIKLLTESDEPSEYVGKVGQEEDVAGGFESLNLDFLVRLLIDDLSVRVLSQTGYSESLQREHSRPEPDNSTLSDELVRVGERVLQDNPERPSFTVGDREQDTPDVPTGNDNEPEGPADEQGSQYAIEGRLLTAPVEAKSEFTYGVTPAGFLDVFGDNNFCSINLEGNDGGEALDDLGRYVTGAVRSVIAKTDLLRQAIAYCPPVKVVQEDGHLRVKIGVYVRNKTNNEGQLSQKLSIGLGGHLEGSDVSYFMVDDNGTIRKTETIDLLSSIYSSMEREISEEVSFGDDAQIMLRLNPVGFVVDTEEDNVGYVGNHHFGAIYPVEVVDDTEFEMTEHNNDAVGWFDAADLKLALLKVENGATFEPWSKAIIDQLAELSTDPQEVSSRLIQMWGLSTAHLSDQPAAEPEAPAEVNEVPKDDDEWISK